MYGSEKMIAILLGIITPLFIFGLALVLAIPNFISLVKELLVKVPKPVQPKVRERLDIIV